MATTPQSDTEATPQKRARSAAVGRTSRPSRTSTRRAGESLTPEEVTAAKGAFLDAYALHGNVGAACEAARIHRATIYRWLEHDETFALLYQQAKAEYDDLVREEIDRRARRGWTETVYQLAKRAGSVRKYSDALLIFQAKARMSEYREKAQVELSGPDGGPLRTQQTMDYAALQQVLLTALDAYPEAKYAVAAALAELDASRSPERPTEFH